MDFYALFLLFAFFLATLCDGGARNNRFTTSSNGRFCDISFSFVSLVFFTMPTIQHIFADESSQNGHGYMVHAGLIVEDGDLVEAEARINAVRNDKNLTTEMKWGKVSKAKLDAYKSVVDTFFDLNMEDKVHFHSLVIDCSKLNHKEYNNGSAEIGFNKFIYQLLMKFGRLYHETGHFHCNLDERTTKQSLEELRAMLNNGIAKRHNVHVRPFKRVQFLNSSTSTLLQVADILMGAIACENNGHHKLEGASPPRVALLSHIQQRSGINTFTSGTTYSRQRFTVWHMQLKNGS